MPILQDSLFQKIDSFHQKAENLIETEQFSDAVKEYQKAWNTLPEPKQLWDAALWIKVGQAECFLALEEYDSAKQKLLDAILCGGAVSNPLVHLLLGISFFETNEKDNAREELQIAYDLDGESIFQEGDEKYKRFLLSHFD
ncbi:MAG: tetratricopeptide repeat protein [gamma proteobacterium symbiont of Bathyaustriella thionipta]|nr:tetratricopeptide repeat protein [gamma proteobacterium symbiont of Bathyaustriella thionipta]MCU7949477.1 tetratricopeptide repeat protein [gamma proteobacterium symbiont of Bathyaustriella thionipta]MCU7953575.1 tetratricopeptide repeat protein [gamma proteobacterium symbiont of Bathyaustriella thionipta]MCU7955931.1 tetratricopeptide repeat protein [gamma proteobacterium symbiont of Bathyaustriella thionipta]MCU7967724.1 tetratricopeptide repeat protein [gamma proteobacterium symbiont of 